MSFELAAKMAYRNAVPKAGAVLLEPIMKLEVLTPEEKRAKILEDRNRKIEERKQALEERKAKLLEEKNKVE